MKIAEVNKKCFKWKSKETQSLGFKDLWITSKDSITGLYDNPQNTQLQNKSCTNKNNHRIIITIRQQIRHKTLQKPHINPQKTTLRKRASRKPYLLSLKRIETVGKEQWLLCWSTQQRDFRIQWSENDEKQSFNGAPNTTPKSKLADIKSMPFNPVPCLKNPPSSTLEKTKKK